MNRIDRTFQQLQKQNSKALVTYICAGDPDLFTTEQIVYRLEEAGADLIELGVPFSDPLADGPVIQKATQRALQAGTNVQTVLSLVERLRRHTEIPLILMGYINPLLRYGFDRFVQDAVSCGVDGIIIPDLPVEEAHPFYGPAQASGLATIPLVAPTSTPERIEQIVQQARGFIYCVSVTGVTGLRESIPPGVVAMTEVVRQRTRLPVVVGFGISRPQHVRQLAVSVDGVVVGSAIVQLIEETASGNQLLAKIGDLVGSLKRELV